MMVWCDSISGLVAPAFGECNMSMIVGGDRPYIAWNEEVPVVEWWMVLCHSYAK